MVLLSASLEAYIDENSSNASKNLLSIDQKAHEEHPGAHMISGPLVCQFLKMLIKISNAQRILDIGTYVGYSALSMAEALDETGLVISCERREENYLIAKQNVENHPKGEKVKLFFGSAFDCIESIDEPLDLIFLDANKNPNMDYYQKIIPKLKPNGILVIDDALWKGEITNPSCAMVESIDKLNQFIKKDPRVESLLLPLRNGLNVVYKK